MVFSQRLAIVGRKLKTHSICCVRHEGSLCSLQSSRRGARGLHTTAFNETVTPFRKQLKEEAKARRATAKLGANVQNNGGRSHSEDWELTVGIEVHAQLNTERKLFSSQLPCH